MRNAPGEVQAIVTVGLQDVLNSVTDDAEHCGVIITSMISGNKYLFRTTDIDYINDGDFRRYQQKRRVQ